MAAEPLVFRPAWRPWWPRVIGFSVIVVAALVGASVKSSVSAGDLVIGVAMVGALGLFSWWLMSYSRRRVMLEFDGWLMTVVPFAGRTRTVDVREIGRIRFRHDRGVAVYHARLRGDRWWREFGVPIGIVGDAAAEHALLVRLATVDDLDADETTAAALSGWRDWLRATGENPAAYPPRVAAAEPEIPAPYGPTS